MGETWTWIAPDGTTLVLNDFAAGLEVLDGISGRHMPPVRRDRTTKAGQPGSTLTALDYDMRTLSLPVMVRSDTEEDLRTLVRSVERTFDPTAGDGTLRLDTWAGDTRDLVCRYVEGLELDETFGTGKFPGAVQTILTFEADRPFWQPTTYPPLIWTLNPTATAFFPIFPLRLGASQIFAKDSVDVGTDVETYPLWTFTGPGSQIKVTNLSTGRVWSYNGTLGSSEILTVDTRPREYSDDPKSVRGGDGSWLFANLKPYRDLWPFVKGTNFLQIEMAGATTASQVRCDLLPQYLGA